MESHILWTEKYRPKKVEDCILPDNIKKTFQEYVDRKEIPNLLLSGTAGVGKTTIAKALCETISSSIVNKRTPYDFVILNVANRATPRTALSGSKRSNSIATGIKVEENVSIIFLNVVSVADIRPI